MVDRYGDLPRGAMNLIDIALLRARAAASGVSDISQKGRTLCFTLSGFDFNAIGALCAKQNIKSACFSRPRPTSRP